MEITHGRWRALARSSPWRWRSVHLTWHHALDDEDAVAWLRDRMAADLEDPFWQTYLWIALLDPVELADGDWSRDPATGHEVRGDPPVLLPDPYERLGWPTARPVPGTVLADLRETERRGRRTWWAQVTPTWAYDPRCSCCPLLRGEVTEWLESSGGGPVRPLHGPAGGVRGRARRRDRHLRGRTTDRRRVPLRRSRRDDPRGGRDLPGRDVRGGPPAGLSAQWLWRCAISRSSSTAAAADSAP